MLIIRGLMFIKVAYSRFHKHVGMDQSERCVKMCINIRTLLTCHVNEFTSKLFSPQYQTSLCMCVANMFLRTTTYLGASMTHSIKVLILLHLDIFFYFYFYQKSHIQNIFASILLTKMEVCPLCTVPCLFTCMQKCAGAPFVNSEYFSAPAILSFCQHPV